MQCPKCDAEIGRSTYCGCGWKKARATFEQRQEPDVPCAHADCGIAAMCRVKVPTGWANLCWQHYDQHFRDQAIDNLDKYGLERQADETVAEHVTRMRTFFRKSFRSIRNRDDAMKALIQDYSGDVGTQA